MGDNWICRHGAQRLAQRVVLVVVVLVAGAAAALAQPRAPLPDAPAQARAQQLLRDVYGKEYDAAKTSKQKTELAKKLLDQAAKSKGDPASHFVLLRVAKEVAVLGADGETALEAVERMVATYDVDAMEMRLDCVKGLADAAKLSSQHAALAEQAYSLVDVALAEEDFEAAGRFGQIAEQFAKRGRNYSLLKEVVARMEDLDEIQQAHAEYQKAVARLDESPTDPEANLAAGRYLCLSRGDWDRGIPMLALGDDPALKVPAVKELVGADSPDAQVALGDAWWDAAQSKEGRERDSLLLRAGHWYERAQPKVTSGLSKVKLDQRLEEMAKIERPVARVNSGRPHAGRQPPLAVAPFDEKQAKGHQLRWSRHLRVPIVQANSIGMKLALIPPGEFDMGSTQEEIDQLKEEAKQRKIDRPYIDRLAAEGPRHRVRITRPFYVGMGEVTQAEYQQVMGTDPSDRRARGGIGPVGNLSWNDAQEFCRRLSELPKEKAAGNVYQLPTEAQWEYACRAGTTTRFYFGDDERQLGYHAWFLGNSGRTVHPVGQKMPNAWGVYDMHGNVWEWCADGRGADYYRQSPRDDPSGPASARDRVLRGGSWADGYPGRFRCAHRPGGGPRDRGGNRGFRVAMTVAP